MNNFNLNLAIQNIKTLVDFCRCVNCDKVDEKRLRYICGHSICEKCVAHYETCMFCSPPNNTTPIIDKSQSDRIRHTSELLKSFQELFSVDVNKHCRISEQLKIEKELFPDCIQAPIKYFNKRKTSVFDKENINPFPLPGEHISNTIKNKMENSINYVKQWFDNNEQNTKPKRLPRKPFADLDINSSFTNKLSTKVPRTHKKAINNIDNQTSTSKRLKKSFSITLRKRAEKCEHQESGIGLESDIIILDDSQSDIVDKDKCALRAVMDAEKNDNNFIENNLDLDERQLKGCCQSTSLYKVPFYRKSSLVDDCSLNSISKSTNTQVHDSMKNVTLTIDSKSFVTTIKLSQVMSNKNVTKKSVAIQSNDSELCFRETISNVDTPNEATNNKYDSEAKIFSECVIEEKGNNSSIKSKCIIIEESDVDSSDTECHNKELEVEAEVHRSSELIDYILTPLESHEFVNRKRSFVRGKTPASSDSSDKENYDPNRKKRFKCNKKIKNKIPSARKM